MSESQPEKPPLFDDFSPVTKQDWINKTEQDLKGASLDTLVWHTQEGLTIEPFYTTEDTSHVDTNLRPGSFPFTRGTKTQNNDWEVRQEIVLSQDYKAANKKALDLLQNGITALTFKGEITSAEALHQVLQDIQPEHLSLHFTQDNSQQIAQWFAAWLQQNQVDPTKVKGSFNLDPIGVLVSQGGAKEGMTEAWQESVETIKSLLPAFRILTIDVRTYHEAGATAVQELGLALAHTNSYLDRWQASQKPVVDLLAQVSFHWAVGTNFFMELAKLRAFRQLYAQLVQAYRPEAKEQAQTYLHCSTAQRNLGAYDPHVNLLRGTTQTMAAAMAGADAITVTPFDAVYKQTEPFSERMARNTQLILKHESYLDQVIDPAAGSYYLENLTESLAQAGWAFFQQIEAEGGFIAALSNSFIHQQIADSRQKLEAALSKRKETLLGINQYPNPKDELSSLQEEAVYHVATPSGNQEIKPLSPFRAAQPYEQLRLALEQHQGEKPSIFLLPTGNLKMRLARAAFARNFFGVAGYPIIDHNGYDSIAAGCEAAIQQKSSVIVLCSSDEEYPELVAELCASLPEHVIPVLAGDPGAQQSAYEAAGIKHFIHRKSNLLETLQEFHQKLGITA